MEELRSEEEVLQHILIILLHLTFFDSFGSRHAGETVLVGLSLHILLTISAIHIAFAY